MSLWIKPERVSEAIKAIAVWRNAVKTSPAMHLWPLLALIEEGVNKSSWTEFAEENDFGFWDRYCRFPDEKRGRKDEVPFTREYYVEALIPEAKPADYPHRGPATIRTRTFVNAWKAADVEAGKPPRYRLVQNYAGLFRNKVLVKDGGARLVPVVDLAVWLFRERELADGADSKTLENIFLDAFPFEPSDYQQLFRFQQEKADRIFTSEKPERATLAAAIKSVLLKAEEILPDPPPLFEGHKDEDLPTDLGPKSALDENDAKLAEVKKLMRQGTSGIVLRGCPGTGKTWYAKQIARELVADPVAHVFQVQFHSSYGYENFVEGYRPDDDAKSGFRVTDKVFMRACEVASKVKTPVVFIVDEINRGDPSRIFGELLTYIEHDYRGMKFTKAYSGEEAVVPPNLLLLGTMNHFDKSISQLDLAFIRRFDHIDVAPSADAVASFLEDGEGFDADQIQRIVRWFTALQSMLPQASGGIGHTYFKGVKDADELRTVWNHRMLPYCRSLLELEPQRQQNVEASFEAMFQALLGRSANAMEPPTS